tara:strand:- start:26963 stop:27127 length:165 start_codon:yes stop_codon:yes gene_type:complete
LGNIEPISFRKFGSLNAFQQDDDCLILDIECEVTFEIRTKYKEAITVEPSTFLG